MTDTDNPLGLTQPTISHYLKILVDAGIFTDSTRQSASRTVPVSVTARTLIAARV